MPVLLGPIQKAFSCANSLTDSGYQVLRREVLHSLRMPIVEDGDCKKHKEQYLQGGTTVWKAFNTEFLCSFSPIKRIRPQITYYMCNGQKAFIQNHSNWNDQNMKFLSSCHYSK